MRRILKISLLLVLLALLLALGGGYLGALHPAGDSLAVFRAYFVAPVLLLAALALVTGMRLVAGVSGLCGILALISVWGLVPLGKADAAQGSGFELYQKNMLFRNPDPSQISADILARRPDFVTLQEVSPANRVIFDHLRAVYPAQHYCPFAGVGGVGISSVWPKVEGSGLCAVAGRGMAAMQVVTPNGPVWVVSMHLFWPWPHSQDAQLKTLWPVLGAFEGKVVIGGDFNMVPWSHQLRQVERTSRAELLGPATISLVKAGGFLRVPIDHVLVTGGQGQVRRLPLLGSDHFGLLAGFELSP